MSYDQECGEGSTKQKISRLKEASSCTYHSYIAAKPSTQHTPVLGCKKTGMCAGVSSDWHKRGEEVVTEGGCSVIQTANQSFCHAFSPLHLSFTPLRHPRGTADACVEMPCSRLKGEVSITKAPLPPQSPQLPMLRLSE